MNVSENNGRILKSQRQQELAELRDKGLAKSGRGKLNDCELQPIILCCCMTFIVPTSRRLLAKLTSSLSIENI